MTTLTTLSVKSARASRKYTLAVCIKLFRANENGWGASSLGFEYGLTTRQADSAIDAGREYCTFKGLTPDAALESLETISRFNDPAYQRQERNVARSDRSIRRNVC